MNAVRLARKAARRLFRDCIVDARLDEERARRVAVSLIEFQRRNSLRVLSQFRRLVRLERDRRAVCVEGACPVPADVRARIVADLTQRYGRGLQVSFNYDPRLIGRPTHQGGQRHLRRHGQGPAGRARGSLLAGSVKDRR